MNTQRIHLHTPDGQISCRTGRHNDGLLLLSTDHPAMTTCGPCLWALDPDTCTPITADEFAGMVHRARGVLARAMDPLETWLADRDRAAERRHRALIALDALYIETPWWHLRTRHQIRQALAYLAPETRA